MMLKKLLQHEQYFEHVVIALNGSGDTLIARQLDELGIQVHHLNIKASKYKWRALARLVKLVRVEKPSLVQGWMYHANVFALLSKCASPRVPIFWNIRHSVHDISHEPKSIRMILKLAAIFMPFVSKVIYNSQTSLKQHEALGLPFTKSVMLANGFELERFSPSRALRERWRESLGVGDKDVLIGVVARYHAMKGHKVFLESLQKSLQSLSSIRAVLIGPGVDEDNCELMNDIRKLGLDNSVQLLGERDDVAQVINACDIFVSPSLWGEGFSNVVGEAMALEVPCIVTDVGDSALIVDRFGYVVPPANKSVMSKAILTLAAKSRVQRIEMGQDARKRIEEHFSLASITAQYSNLYARQLGCESALENYSSSNHSGDPSLLS
jgi:glycosyltransferase involved in cell wall biosynthesis